MDIDYILDLDDDVEVTVYKSGAIHDLKGGWYKVNGKIIYPDGSYDYYGIRVYSKRRMNEYYNRIYSRGC